MNVSEAVAERETLEYDIYPPALWEPYRTYRFECGEGSVPGDRCPTRGQGGTAAADGP
jgi:hypothetical protein